MLYDFKRTSRKKSGSLVKITQVFLFFLAASLIPFLVPFLKRVNPSLPTDFDQLKKEVLRQTNDPQAHLRLADFYFRTNDFETAKKELALTLSLNPNHPEAKDLENQIKGREEEPEKIKTKIQDWEKILAQKPGYRDAYLQLAILNWQVYQEKQTLEAINKALELDPNSETAKSLQQTLLE